MSTSNHPRLRSPSKTSFSPSSSTSMSVRPGQFSPKKRPPPGLHLGTVIHPSVPRTNSSAGKGKDDVSSPDPLALSDPDEPGPEAKVELPKRIMGRGLEEATRATPMRSRDAAVFRQPKMQRSEEPEAGPSRTRARAEPVESASSPMPGGTTIPTGTPEDIKGKGKAVERRVLPARIRRPAGGGAEGMRDVEEMIVDWLERWGEPQTTPPENLSVHLTSIPLDLVDPPTTRKDTAQPPTPVVTLTPTRRKVDMEEREAAIRGEDKIETPSWRMVSPGEDDRWEAQEELDSLAGNLGKGPVSPVKRLRKGLVGDEPDEDTSDAYYASLHKKYETFERRQRIREKEKLQFERYKMRSRIDLLRNMSKDAWSAVVATVFQREGEGLEKGKREVEERGAEWLRRKLVKEGEEVMKRYEELLPPEQRKHKEKASTSLTQPDSRVSTPTQTTLSPSPSLTPPPAILPARVTALRDLMSTSSKRKATSAAVNESPVGSPSQRQRSRSRQQRAPSSGIKLGQEEDVVVEYETPSRPSRAHPANASLPKLSSVPTTADPTQSPVLPVYAAHAHVASHSHTHSSNTSIAHPPRAIAPIPVPPQPSIPVLIEAANRRELAQSETESSKVRAEAPRAGRLIAREKTRASRRLEVVSPFGMPVPGVVEYKSDFTLTDEEDFWPIIAAREEKASKQRRASLLLGSSATSNTSSASESTADDRLPDVSQASGYGGSHGKAVEVITTATTTTTNTTTVLMTPEEVEEMEGVEAAVVF